MDTLAKRLAEARKKSKMTQPQLAQASGVAQSDISKIERGQILRPGGLVSLAKALQVSPYWLDDGTGEMNAGGLWPFPGIDPARFGSLTPEQKIEIRGVVRGMIQAFEAERGNVRRNGTDP